MKNKTYVWYGEVHRGSSAYCITTTDRSVPL